tara:strand:- start:158 stop:793 length:636 start_codon:yes stop_codon:yes gene_type:complete
MVWPFNNQQQQPQQGAMNLGLGNNQQQVPMQQQGGLGYAPNGIGANMQPQGGMYNQQQQNQWGQQQYQPPPTEMEIISALISSNPVIERWIMSDANLQPLIGLLSSVIAVSVHQILANCSIKEEGDVMKFDFSAVQGLPTADSVTMNITQLQNQASNVVQQQTMQIQQMVAMANQGNMQGMLDSAMADPGMMQSVGGGIGSLVRSMATGGR